MNINGNFKTYVEIDEQDIEVLVAYSGYYEQGISYGLPENCYPDEGEIELVEVHTEDGNILDKLSSTQQDKLIEKAWEHYGES